MKASILGPGLAALLVALGAASECGAAGAPTIAFLRGVDSGTAYAEGRLHYLARGLDAAGFRYAPAPLPPDVRRHLASALEALRAKGSDRTARSYLRREAEKFGLEGILLLDATGGGRTPYSLLGSAPPFDAVWSVEMRPAPEDSAWAALQSLADSAAARFGSPTGAHPRVPARSAEAEDLYARGTETGALLLLARAVEAGDHDAARSALGFRLFARGCRGRGLAELERVDESGLGVYERSLHRARAAYASGIRADFERDVETLERAFPQRFETLLLRGLARLERGDLEKARDVLERAVRANPSEPLAHLLLAETALRDGHLAAAREEYRRVLILDPHDALAPIGLASVLYSEGSLDEAEAALAEAPLADPHLPEGMRPRFLREAARAGLLLAEGRFVAAKGILSRARNEAYRAGDEESLVDLTIRRFYVFLEQGETDSAGTELSEVRFRGSAPFLRTEKTGAVAALEGLLGAHRRDYGTVIAKRLELETVPASNAAERGVFESLYYIFQGSTWEARLPLRAALRERDCARIRHLLGRASIGSAGQTASAIDDLEWVANRGESLLDLPPVLAVNFYYLGRAFEERGQKPDAEMAYREFLHYRRHADGGSPEVAHATAYARGGETGPPGRR